MAALRIAVAGAGTGGLATAAFLAHDGHDVRLFERFSEPRPIGAGLMLQPTGLACLAMLGLDRLAIERGQPIAGIFGDTVGGRCIFDVSYAELGAHVFGIAIHRGALFRLLYDEVRRLGVPITSSVEVKSTRLVGSGRLLTDAGGNEHGPFDLVVDGTGMRSPLRATEAQIRVDRLYAYGAIWGIVEEPEEWPHKSQLRQRYDGCSVMIGILPVGPANGHRLTALFWSMRVADYGAWRSSSLDIWRDRVVSLWPEIEPFVAQVRSHGQMTLASYADTVLRQPFEDRLLFIGDAARATSPQLGQGANLALIDAATLAACLRCEAVPAALARYGRSRRAHTRFYSWASRWLTPFFQSDSRVCAGLRDFAFPLMGKVPYIRREMVRTLSGMKTGLFSHLDPGHWHPSYALARPTFSSQPA